MKEEKEELTIEQADEFIKNKAIKTLIRADVTELVHEVEAFYGDSLDSGTIGDNWYISNCPLRGEYTEDGDFIDLDYDDEITVNKWYVVDERFVELLRELGEIVVVELNLWGCQDNVDDVSETEMVKDFFERMQILHGQTNAIIKEDLKA